MSDKEVLAGDLQQTVRVLATIGGRMAERLARLRADQARDQQLKTQEQIRTNQPPGGTTGRSSTPSPSKRVVL